MSERNIAASVHAAEIRKEADYAGVRVMPPEFAAPKLRAYPGWLTGLTIGGD